MLRCRQVGGLWQKAHRSAILQMQDAPSRAPRACRQLRGPYMNHSPIGFENLKYILHGAAAMWPGPESDQACDPTLNVHIGLEFAVALIF